MAETSFQIVTLFLLLSFSFLISAKQGSISDLQSLFGNLGDLDSALLSLFGGASPGAQPLTQNIYSLLNQTRSHFANTTSGDLGPLLKLLNRTSASSQTLENPLSGAGSPTVEAAAASRASTLLDQLQDSLDGLDSLFNYPQYPDLLADAGFNMTELLEEDHPMLSRMAMEGEKFGQRYCQEGYLVPPKTVPTSCTGGSYTVVVDGGSCHVQPDKSVRCKQPRVVLMKTPPSCAYHHKTAGMVVGKECKLVREFGTASETLLKPVETTAYDISHGWGGVREQLRELLSSDWTPPLVAARRKREPSPDEDGNGEGLLGRVLQRLRRGSADRGAQGWQPMQAFKKAWGSLKDKLQSRSKS